MKLYTQLAFAGLIACSLMVAGCGGGPALGTVSGTVTLDGEPLGDVELIFEPKQVQGGSADVGPYSIGVTDASGKYTLNTRNGNPGAVIGDHTVNAQFAGEDPQEALSEAMQNLKEAKAGEGDPAKVSEYQAQVDKWKNFKGLPERYSGLDSELSATIVSGDNTVDFALTTTKGEDE